MTKGLIRENTGTEAERVQSRQQEDAIVAEMQTIGGVHIYYPLLAWPAALLVALNCWLLLRKGRADGSPDSLRT